MIKLKTISMVAGLGFGLFVFGQGAASPLPQESHIGNLSGHADGGGAVHPDRGKQLYGRYCVGCHGTNGDGNGENGPWIDPKPRDFTTGVFKCRSTPTGKLPTDQDLFNAITRGFVNTNMPPWVALTKQNRADLVAYVKTFRPAGKTSKQAFPSRSHPSHRSPLRRFCTGANSSRRLNVGNATAPRVAGTARRRRSLPTARTIRFVRMISRSVHASSAAIRTRICTEFS
jgi:Cytochrome C oxidase, cbb3-type, subunit III